MFFVIVGIVLMFAGVIFHGCDLEDIYYYGCHSWKSIVGLICTLVGFISLLYGVGFFHDVINAICNYDFSVFFKPMIL